MMNIPVWVEHAGGTFTASLLGAPTVKAFGATKDEAVAALHTELNAKQTTGELVFIDIQPKGWLELAEKYKNDPLWKETWDEIKNEAYRYRDELKAREFPE